MSRIFGQPAIANLAQTKAVLDDVKRVFHLGPNAGLDLFHLLQHLPPRGFWQTLALARPHGYVPIHLGIPVFLSVTDTLIASISKNIRPNPIGGRPRFPEKQCGPINFSSAFHGTGLSSSDNTRSRWVTFFFAAYSNSEKLI